jgi:anti-repressor protein
MIFVNEPNLYRVIFQSRKPVATKFQNWIFDDVIPAIRTTGSYSLEKKESTPKNLTLKELAIQHKHLAEQLITACEKNEKLTKQIEDEKPKVEFYNDVTQSEDVINMGECAKVLNLKDEHGKTIGRNKLMQMLSKVGILMDNNMPYQRYVDAKYFKVVEVKIDYPNGSCGVRLKSVVYQKGLDFIRNRIKIYVCWKSYNKFN